MLMPPVGDPLGDDPVGLPGGSHREMTGGSTGGDADDGSVVAISVLHYFQLLWPHANAFSGKTQRSQAPGPLPRHASDRLLYAERMWPAASAKMEVDHA